MSRARWVGALVAMFVATGCTGSKEEQKPDSNWEEMEYTWAPHEEERPRDLTPLESATENVVLTGATIYTVSGDPIEDGSIWLKDGRIEKVAAGKIDADGAQTIDVSGKFVTPGLIDTHSHLGVYPSPGVSAHSDGNEATSPTTPQVDAINSVWPQDPGFERALRGGITALQILPGSANLIGGSAVTLRLHPGISSRAMLFEDAPRGIKMACGENPKRVYGSRGGMPSTRMGNMAVWRATFQKAVEYRDQLAAHEEAMKRWMASPERESKPRPNPPPRDHAMETLVSVLEGDTLVHVHCYRADEMVQVLQLADEYGFQIRSFHHAVEAYKIRDILARWNVGVSTWADWWGFKIEAHDAILENAALVSEAGAPAIIHSDSSVGIQRLNQEAAKAYHAGKRHGVDVSENDALKWITVNPAWALGIDDETGTLDAGKRADVVVWDKHPLSVYSKAQMVFVGGVREYDANRDDERWSDFEVGQLPEEGGER